MDEEEEGPSLGARPRQTKQPNPLNQPRRDRQAHERGREQAQQERGRQGQQVGGRQAEQGERGQAEQGRGGQAEQRGRGQAVQRGRGRGQAQQGHGGQVGGIQAEPVEPQSKIPVRFILGQFKLIVYNENPIFRKSRFKKKKISYILAKLVSQITAIF